ncbi:superoxide dismutase 1 copper chaperone [Nadsonia fulvescens var. elongata DSM 6958]|uniref:Superoxide dismutase 1 copper chaperone n=1 Tax=Nadsonia fulvescens var. elongata DSM 6958 TaxID=857566 RepID=A0A1E3PIJ6_9ASCO|nr:superoxide dismutase 1 copper chaperone [Nadsonia fulvescens var. elongata DSM 6958]
MVNNDAFTSTYSIPLECDKCCESVKKAINTVSGVTQVNCDLAKQFVSVTGFAAPSQIVKSVQAIGKDAIVRGTGEPNSAAVCIFESFDPKDRNSPVKGLARIVAVSPTQTLFDITLNGLPKGTYYPTIRQSGNTYKGGETMGSLYADLGIVEVNEPTSSGLYSGQSFLKKELQITDIIGRGIAVSSRPNELDSSSVVGVLARSAGVWENDKSVCSCSGKTLWQERQDAIEKGVN